MKRVVLAVLLCLFILNCFAIQKIDQIDFNSIALKQASVTRDFDHYEEMVYYPYTIGLMLWMSDWNAYGMEMYGWEDEWVNYMTWNFQYQGDLIGEATLIIEDMSQIMTHTISGGLYTETLAQIDLMGTLMDVSHYNYYYDGSQISSYEAQQSDFMGGWINEERGTYTYDGDEISQYLIEIFNEETEEWGGVRVIDYVHSGGNLVEIVEQVWMNDEWVYNTKIEHTWQGDLMSGSMHYEWDGSEWVYDYRETLFSSGDVIEYGIMEDWDGSGWVNEYKDIYSYISGNIMDEILSQLWDGSGWINDMKTVYIFSNESDESEIPTAEVQMINYPNPFNPVTTINFQNFDNNKMIDLKIFNTKGQVVKEDIITTDNYVWDATNNEGKELTSGIYFCVAKSGSKQAVHKLILMK